MVVAGCKRGPGEATPEDLSAGDQVAATAPAGSAREHPNVILIVVDDQAANTLGVEGNPVVRTPRLDRLAGQGAYFSRAYVPIPQCAPSRAALLTGLYPHQNGILTNEGARLGPEAVTFAELFKKKGYACGLIGKWHLGDAHQSQAGFYDKWVSFDAPGDYYDPQLWVDGEKIRAEGYLTNVLTDYAIEFVNQHREGPFLLWLNYKAPHGPTFGPPEKRFLYEPADMPLPESMADDLSGKPVWQRESYMHQLFNASSEETIRRRLARYYAMISSVDYNVGRLTDHLKEADLEPDTLVIYMSDNGSLQGEHRMLTKGPVFYEEVVRSPLIMCWPGRIGAGTRVEALVSSLDLFPTLCGLADIPVPADLPGEDLWPVVSDPSGRVREAVFFEYHTKEATGETVPMRGLVTPRYKYVRYLKGGEELYDLQADPQEMRNLIQDPAHEETADALRKKLDEWRAETGDSAE